MRLTPRVCCTLAARSVRMSEIFTNCDPFKNQPDLDAFLRLQREAGDFDRLKQWLCTPPQYTTLRVNTLTSSVLEMKEQLQKYLDSCSRENGDEVYRIVEHPHLSETLVVMSPRNRVQLIPHKMEVIVSLECGEAVLRGANVFVPGLIGAPSSLQKGDLTAVYADVNNECRRGDKRRFNGVKLFIGNGLMKVSRDDIFKGGIERGVAVEMTQPVYNCPPLNNIFKEKLFLQNIPSIVCAHVLDPRPGQTVLDMCSAPGGKTAHLATLMCDRGTVIALDKAKARLQKTIDNCSAWRLNSVRCFVHDATMSFNTNPDLCDVPRHFDRILVDAPCSALGQRPRLNYRQTLREVESYPNVQKALLKAASELVKQDGVIVYSTCSINEAENEDVVVWALENLPLQLNVQQPHLGGIGRKVKGLAEVNRVLLQRFEGIHEGEDYDRDTIGFFIAKFKLK